MTRAPTPSHFGPGWETVAVCALRQFDLGPGGSPLSIAAGNGDLGILATRPGADVTAVDVSPTMTERLDKRAAHSERLDIEAHLYAGPTGAGVCNLLHSLSRGDPGNLGPLPAQVGDDSLPQPAHSAPRSAIANPVLKRHRKGART